MMELYSRQLADTGSACCLCDFLVRVCDIMKGVFVLSVALWCVIVS